MQRNNGTDPLVVLASELVPLIDEWIRKYEADKGIVREGRVLISMPGRGGDKTATGMSSRGNKADTFVQPLGALTCLEHRSGVDARRIWSIRGGRQKYVTLDIADDLLSAMDLTQALHNGMVTIIPNPNMSNEVYWRYLSDTGRQCQMEAGA